MKETLRRILTAAGSRLEEKPDAEVVFWALLSVAGFGIMDLHTGAEISFSIFYVAPVSMVAWYVSGRMAVAVAAAAAAVWLGADIFAGNEYSHKAIPVWNSIVRLGFFVTVGGLTASIRRRLDDEERLADTDSLTGLANARFFYEKVEAEIVRQKRYRNPFTLVYIDLDNFKAVNDRWGHEAGDDLLVNVARILQQNTRASDEGARLGGDEFAVLFPMTGGNDAEAAVTVLQGRLDDCMTKNLWPVTFSVGVVTFVGAPRNVRDAVKAADDRMYAAKRRGKNCISYETRDGEGIIEHRSHE